MRKESIDINNNETVITFANKQVLYSYDNSEKNIDNVCDGIFFSFKYMIDGQEIELKNGNFDSVRNYDVDGAALLYLALKGNKLINCLNRHILSFLKTNDTGDNLMLEVFDVLHSSWVNDYK